MTTTHVRASGFQIDAHVDRGCAKHSNRVAQTLLTLCVRELPPAARACTIEAFGQCGEC